MLYRLVSQADVFLTNLRLFEREKFQVEYVRLHKQFPRLIYGSLTGYGKEGPGSELTLPMTLSLIGPGQEWGHLFSKPGELPLVGGAAVGDNVAGLGLAFGIMTVFVRKRMGTSQEVGSFSPAHRHLPAYLLCGRDSFYWT